MFIRNLQFCCQGDENFPCKLGHEQCEICELFALHNNAHIVEQLQIDCDVCSKWNNHIVKANESRQQYRTDRAKHSQTDHVIYSADLQKVIMLPRLDMFKSALFTRRIIAFNESFVPLGTQSSELLKPIAVIWHEATAGRKTEDIISAFHAFFLHCRDAKTVTVWLDNCAAQNKNWTLFCYLLYIVNSEEIAADLTELKYFEPGHTFMSADNFHHQVEKSLKKAGKVYDFNDFCTCVQEANSGRVHVKHMKAGNFFDWPDVSSTYKLNRSGPRPYVSDFVMVTATRGSRVLTYKTAFDSNDTPLNFLTAAAQKRGLGKPSPRCTPRGIPQVKRDDIISKCGGLMPANRLKFWSELPISNVVDLASGEE